MGNEAGWPFSVRDPPFFIFHSSSLCPLGLCGSTTLYVDRLDLLRSEGEPQRPLERAVVMEILGIGTDIVECLRIGRMIESHGERFLNQVFTLREIRFCNDRTRTLEHFAAIWVGKEAILKALGLTGRGLNWTDIEICQEGNGRPEVQLSAAIRDAAERQGVGTVLLSLAHCRAYATAYAMAVRGT